MAYIKPEDVIAPQKHWKLGGVLYDGGEGKTSIAYGRWADKPGDGEPVVVMRWNGSQTGKLGNPQSSGNATWFVLPHRIAVATLRSLLEMRTAGNSSVRSQELDAALEPFEEISQMCRRRKDCQDGPEKR